MQNKSRINRVVAEKVIEYCKKIEMAIQRFGSSFEDYCKDEYYQLSCSACIIQIGELTTHFSDEFKTRHDEIDWKKIKGLRNIHVHEYEKIKPEIMWEIINENVPELKAQLEQILSSEE